MIPYAPFDVAFGEDVTIDGSPGRAIVSRETLLMDGDLEHDRVVASVGADSPMAVGSTVVWRRVCYVATRRIDDSDKGWARWVLAKD